MATAPGQRDVEDLQAAGATAAQIEAWRKMRMGELSDAGATDDQVKAYFGYGEPDSAAVTDLVAREWAEPAEGEPKKAAGLREAWEAGFQTSMSGLAARRQLPDIVVDDESSFLEIVASGISQGIGDLPVSVPSFVGGAKIGAPIGGAAGATAGRTPLSAAAGATAGALVGGGMTSGFITEGSREAYIDFLRQNGEKGVIVGPRDFAARLSAAVFRKETLQAGGKGAVVEGTIGAVTPFARGVAGKVVKNVVAREAVVTSAEATAAVGVTAALEGELPEGKDFAATAATLLGFKAGEVAVTRTSKSFADTSRRLQDHWTRTGEPPAAAMERVKNDPVFREQIVGGYKEDASAASTVRESDAPALNVSDFNEPETIIFDPKKIGSDRAASAKAAETGHSAVTDAAGPQPKEPTKATEADVNDMVAQARAKYRERIKPAGPIERPINEQVDWFRYRYINDLQFMVSESQTGAKKAGSKLSIEENPGELARLARGAHAKADLAIRDGVYTADGKTKIVDGFEPILKRLPKEKVEDFLHYTVAKRVMEKESQGLKTGFDVLDSDLLAKAGDKDPVFRKALTDLQTWQNTMVDRLVDAGLLSADGAKGMKEANRDYVPFARVMDDARAPGNVTSRGLPVRKAAKEFTGSERDIFNPFEVMIKNRYMLQQIADNNVARQRLVEFNKALPDEAKFLKPAKKIVKPIKLAETDTQLKKFLEDNGLDAEDVNGLMVYRAASKRLGEGEFIVFEDGKAAIYQADNPDLVRSLQAMDQASIGPLTKILSVPSAFLRAGTTTDPAFILKASVRDQMSSVLLNSFKVLPIVDSVIGVANIAGKTPAMVRWIEAGGANSALLSLDRQILSGLLQRDKVNLPVANAWNAITTPYRLMAAASTLMENSMRVGQFVRSEKKIGTEKAALRSRDVALDFARMGANVRAFNMISAWTGATINGIDRTVEAFRTKPVGTFSKTAAMVTLPSLLLWFANKDQEWYQELENWEKAVFWHIEAGKDKDGSPIVLRIPMPQVFGPLFGFLPVQMIEEYGEVDPEFGKALDDALGTAFVSPEDFIPVAISPMLEIGANYNFFTEAPLVSESLKRQLPEYRYTPYTTETAKAVSKMIAPFSGGLVDEKYTTPVAMEYLVRQYTGSIGINTLKTVDAGLKKAGVLPNPVAPAPGYADIPVVGGFFLRFPQTGRSMTDFYDNSERLDEIKASLKNQMKQGDAYEAQRILDIYGAPLLNPTKARTAIGNLRQTAIGVHYHPDIPAEEKRQLIDDLTFAQTEIARAFNTAYEEARRQQKELEK